MSDRGGPGSTEPLPTPVRIALWLVGLAVFLPLICLALISAGVRLPFVMMDCVWRGTAIAWIDIDGDGLRDREEPPLEGVRFVAQVVDQSGGWASSPSNYYGEAEFDIWLSGCPKESYLIRPETPAGYRLTTELPPPVESNDSGGTYEFGFAYLAGFPTVTPRPPGPECQALQIPGLDDHRLTDVAVAPDGSIWATSLGAGAMRYQPGDDAWTTYTVADGLLSNDVRSVNVGVQGTIWLAQNGGASSWDGARWRSYTASDGLVHPDVLDIAEQDGLVWFATKEGISRLGIETQAWTSYTPTHHIVINELADMGIAGDGTLWFSTWDGVLRGMPDVDEPSVLDWTWYEDDYELKENDPARYLYCDGTEDIVAGPDGSVWFAGWENGACVARWTPDEASWTIWNQFTTDGAFNEPRGLAVDVSPDGSLWIGAGPYSPVLYHLSLGAGAADPDTWRMYDWRDGLPEPLGDNDDGNGLVALAVSSPHEVWVVTERELVRCTFPNQ